MNIVDQIILLFCLLFTKHFFIDFVFQTDEQVRKKGIFGNKVGFSHSFEHGVWTASILCFYLPIHIALGLGALDIIWHYLTDYVKRRYGSRNFYVKKFWVQLGLDQLSHTFCYVFIVHIVTKMLAIQ